MNGASRELFEETGIDIRGDLVRLQPASLREYGAKSKKGDEVLPNEHKKRLFFVLNVTDSDFPPHGISPTGDGGKHLKVITVFPQTTRNLLTSAVSTCC